MTGRKSGYACRMSASPTRQATIVVAQASDEIEAAIWVDALRDAGVKAATFERGVGAALGGTTTPWSSYPVVVAEEDLLTARNVIAELGGAGSLAPYHDPAAVRERQSRVLVVGVVTIVAVVAAGIVAWLVG